MAKKKQVKRIAAAKKIVYKYKSFRPSYRAHPLFHFIVVLILLVLAGIILYSLPIAKQDIRNDDGSIPTQNLPMPKDLSNASHLVQIVTFHSLSLEVPPGYNYGYFASSPVYVIDQRPIPQTPAYGGFTPMFSLELMKNKTLDQIKQEFLHQKTHGDKLISKETDSTEVDNHQGLLTKEVSWSAYAGENVNQWDLYIANDQDLYHFTYFYAGKLVNDQKYFDMIVKSFKFTN